MNKKILQLSLAIAIFIAVSSCRHNEPGSANCPGNAVATWKVDGRTFESYVYLYTKVGSVNNFTLTACTTGSNNETVQLAFIPYPPVVGSHPLTWNGYGVWNNEGSGQYLTDEDGNYVTDTTHTGSFDIASVNTTNKTISGSFHFSAHEVNGTRSVNITDGIFTNMKYEN